MAKSGKETKTEKKNKAEEVIDFDTDSMIKEEEPQKNAEVLKLQNELEKEKADYLRLRADYENFRRRNQEATVKARQEGKADAVEAILPAIDSVDRAMKMCADEKSKEGLQLIKKQMENSLAQIGVTEIEAEGKPFDHNFHNAVQRAEVEESEVGKVLEVYQRGYKIGDKVIRYAMVKVGVEKAE